MADISIGNGILETNWELGGPGGPQIVAYEQFWELWQVNHGWRDACETTKFHGGVCDVSLKGHVILDDIIGWIYWIVRRVAKITVDDVQM